MAYDNVIIFGAGASADAGVPLLNNFVDTMWNYSARGRSPHGGISQEDRKLLAEADQIRVDLERYNSRANFKLRNLEDVLSLLSFEALAGGEALQKYQTWVRAITRTVELSTNHPYRSELPKNPKYNKTLYHEFWNALLNEKSRTNLPALITFNYDLVLERTLWEYFHWFNVNDNTFKPARETCKINYFLKPYDYTIIAKPCQYDVQMGNPGYIEKRIGFRPEIEYNCKADVEIPYLK